MVHKQHRQWLGAQGWLGLLLLGICWPLNWACPGSRSAYLFFPLWLGYILLMDAIVQRRTGTSLWSRSRRGFILLFILSAPAWWLFELINYRTANWEYLGIEAFSSFEYFMLCTLSFSTVVPAVFETAELVRSFSPIRLLENARRIPDSSRLSLVLFIVGLFMLALLFAWPRWFYPLVWISLVFIIEPVNRLLGRPYFLKWLQKGDWRPIVSLAVGALICGFFWEMWNYGSWPKWIYHTPGAQFLHVFEMPLLGYGGYIPFAWELFALKNLLSPDEPQLWQDETMEKGELP